MQLGSAIKNGSVPFWWFLGLGVTGFLGYYVFSLVDLQPATKAAPPPAASAPVVSIVRPKRKVLQRTIEQPGHILAFEQTPIYARIPGYVAEVCVDMNARVKKGEVLAKLDVPEMESEYRHKQNLVSQAAAEVEQTRHALEVARANLAVAQAQIAEAETGRKRAGADYERWQGEYQRIETLVARQVLDEQTRDETRNQYRASAAAREQAEAKVKSAQAARDESSARLAKTRADIATAQARLEVARADEQRMKSMLDYRQITAPFDGVVTQRNVHTGHLIKPTGGPSEPLFVVVRIDRVRVFVDVPEVDALFIQPGVPVQVRILASQNRLIAGKVTRISWALEPANRTLRAEIELATPKEDIRPGMYAYAAISVAHPETWTLPASAVFFKGDEAYCCQAVEGKAVHIPLRVGLREGKVVEVLQKRPASSGSAAPWHDLTGSEEIIVSHAGALTDGQTLVPAASAK